MHTAQPGIPGEIPQVSFIRWATNALLLKEILSSVKVLDWIVCLSHPLFAKTPTNCRKASTGLVSAVSSNDIFSTFIR